MGSLRQWSTTRNPCRSAPAISVGSTLRPVRRATVAAVPARSQSPITQVVRGSWEDGTAEFDTGSRAGDEANRRHNRNALRLRRLREDLGLSVTTVAKWAGLERETLRNLENGLTSPDAVTVHRVAVALGLDSELRADADGRIGP